MAPPVELSIPSTSIAEPPPGASSGGNPYTLYHIAVRTPIRSNTVQKRYSDFIVLHEALTAQSRTHTAPPARLPQKNWFRSTVSSPDLTEQRRKGLEVYLRAINTSPDSQWRSCPCWRIFLGLPNTSAAFGSSKTKTDDSTEAKNNMVAALAQRRLDPAVGSAPITDPVVWLDVLREVKSLLRDARGALTRRETAASVAAQHEAGAEAKSKLVRAAVVLGALDRGLAAMADDKRSARSVGEGELRRRRDLVSAARKERDALEVLLSTAATSRGGSSSNSGSPTPFGGGEAGRLGSPGMPPDKAMLLSGSASGSASGPTIQRSQTGVARSGRVLGGPPAAETERTRELDNVQVLELQRELLAEQDAGVEDLTAVVRRMKEMGVAINDELDAQNALLGVLDQDVERVGDKIAVAKKRVGQIK